MLNKVILIGNLGADPEVRYMPSGGAVVTVSLATTMRWKDKQTGERKEVTEWHRVIFFNRLAEIAGEYLKKGSQIYVEGRLQTRKWQTQEGQDRYTTEIVANEMHMLGSRTGGTGAFNEPNTSQERPMAQTTKPVVPPPTTPTNMDNVPPLPSNYDDFDDDIPF